MPDTITTPQGHILAYHQYIAPNDQSPVGVVFLGGLMSDMQGTKALALEAFCKSNATDFIRFDYVGHGESSGEFIDGLIGIWHDNVVEIITQLTQKPQILVGSSLGGWLMLLVAQSIPEKVKGLIGVASAPDFTQCLMWDAFNDDIKEQLRSTGRYAMPSDYDDSVYPITMRLIEEGDAHCVLTMDQIPITCPVRLLHGLKDDDVPYQLSLQLIEKLASDNVQLHLLKESDHRMSSQKDIQLLTQTVKEMLEIFR